MRKINKSGTERVSLFLFSCEGVITFIGATSVSGSLVCDTPTPQA